MKNGPRGRFFFALRYAMQPVRTLRHASPISIVFMTVITTFA